ncbi:hypothetical protein DFP94_11181 [Fontibacillus phaseoli]|uniref:Uncharacterized protein n=1 Tax=Fontibacillus phaseoli TaxID=1416533 RepID=A0A369BAN0_9BACL|nr:hypothetical protein DFP94_11181 [Fontibacillus phaseoli]
MVASVLLRSGIVTVYAVVARERDSYLVASVLLRSGIVTSIVEVSLTLAWNLVLISCGTKFWTYG